MAATYTQQITNRGMLVRRFGDDPVNNTTNEVAIMSQTIKGGALGEKRSIKFLMICQVTTPAIALPSLTIRIKYGSGSLVIASALSLQVLLTNSPFKVVGEMSNSGASNAQTVWGQITQSGTVPIGGVSGNSMVTADWAIDSTVDQTFQITAQFGGLSLGTTLTGKYGFYEIS